MSSFEFYRCILAIIALVLMLFMCFSYYTRKKHCIKSISKKYGIPLNQFIVSKAWNTLPIRNTPTFVSFYEDFLVITSVWTDEEYVIDKETNVKIFYGTLSMVIEILIKNPYPYIGDKKIQLYCLGKKGKQIFLAFFRNIEYKKSIFPQM